MRELDWGHTADIASHLGTPEEDQPRGYDHSMDDDPDNVRHHAVALRNHVDVVHNAACHFNPDDCPHKGFALERKPGGNKQCGSDSANLEPKRNPGVHKEPGCRLPNRSLSQHA